MIFKSRQVNLDPEPWVDDHGSRHATEEAWCNACGGCSTYLRPRPEFDSTRDPKPWAVFPDEESGLPSFRVDNLAFIDTIPHREKIAFLIEWEPRREQFDTPVNLILQEVRLDVQINEVSVEKAVVDALQWVRLYAQPGPFEGSDEVVGEATAEMIEHARRVLTRLANWGREQ